MLRELSVHLMALIEDVRVELEPGFCAWTGETGAGKTLLLEALGLLLGERGNADLIRAGSEELRVVGRFEIVTPELRKRVEKLLDRPLDEGQLLVMRRLNRTGRSTAYLNDEPVTLSTLKQLAAMLIDIHGQRDSQAILQPGYQLELLDAFAGITKLRDEFAALAAEVRDLRSKLQTIETTRQQRARELNLLQFERDELDAAELVAGELEDLVLERDRLTHALALQEFTEQAISKLYDEEGAFAEHLGKLRRDAEHWAGIDPILSEAASRLAALEADTQDLVSTLRPLIQRWNADPQRREEIEERLQKLRRLETKYGQDIAGLIAYRTTLDAKITALESQETDRDSIERDLRKLFEKLKEVGAKLSQKRRQAGKKFVTHAQKELADLSMPDAILEVAWESVELGADPLAVDIPGDGLDRLELLLAANPGEPARPLRKVASGGEMSRTMLALKTVLGGQDQIATFVFDEIDANVGGRLGDVLGGKLAALGRTHQVICVTHLPQVACYARHQWTIRKEKQAKRTVTTITQLSEKERIEELASMLRGASKGETTLKEAAAMLNTAKKKW